MLTPYLARYTLPALAAAIVKGGQIAACGAVGTRRFGTAIPVTIDDRFHIGSDTKAMTALLAGMLTEQGKLRWDSTIAEAFPELAAQMDPRVRAVTLRQPLSHTSGMPSDDDAAIQLIAQSCMLDTSNLDEMRAWIVGAWSKHPLEAAPGTRFAYSNMGYIIAGAMIERSGGKTWEELVSERVFDPLGLETAGLGPQSSMGRVDAPLGHAILKDGTLKPMLAGPDGDNPAVLGPAGVVHLSVLDFARWAGWHTGEGKRGPPLVRLETMRTGRGRTPRSWRRARRCIGRTRQPEQRSACPPEARRVSLAKLRAIRNRSAPPMGNDTISLIARRCERAVITAYRELREHGSDDLGAFQACTALYRIHHPEASVHEARRLVAEWIDHHLVRGDSGPTPGCECG